jgi:hypothetical protein
VASGSCVAGDRSQFDYDALDVIEWKPSGWVTVIWNLLGAALAIAGVAVFGVVWGALTDRAASQVLEWDRGSVLIAALLVFVVHEGVHGLVAWRYGARPKFGAKMLHRVFPVLYCTAPGHYFRRQEFIAFLLAPVVAISLAGVGLMALGASGQWLPVALAVNFGGSIGDYWMTGVTLRQPPGTVIEDREDGMRILRTAPGI